MSKKLINETIIRNILIILTFISLIITYLNFTYLTYQNLNVDIINDFLVNYVNNWILWTNNILLFIFAAMYIVISVKSKKEVLLKISFSIFSILTTMLASTFIINSVAEIFSVF